MHGRDWNGNGRIDAGDRYIDFEIMNDNDGGGGSGGGSGGDGCGCFTAVIMLLGLLYLLGSCS